MPDTYQGAELWDFGLVDPDNRRPVDYAAREAAIGEIRPDVAAAGKRANLFASLMESWRDGRVKIATIALLLALRRERPALFAEGGYRPIAIAGADADWAFGFLRERGPERVAVLLARFPAKREAKPGWDATVDLPEGRWFDEFRGRPADSRAPLREWLSPLPVAVLTEG